MIRNLKALGLALVAMFAMSALVASAAQAQTSFTLTGDAGTTKLDSHGSDHVFRLSGGRGFTCKTITSTNDPITLPSSTATASAPAFTECTSGTTLPGNLPVTVTMNGCSFVFHVTGTDTDGNADHYVGDVDVVCPGSEKIDIHVYEEGTTPAEHGNTGKILCTYTVGPQTVNGGVAGAPAITYDTTTGAKSSEDDVDITVNATGIAVTKSSGNVTNCGGASQTATYVGTSTVTGTDALGNKTGIRLSD